MAHEGISRSRGLLGRDIPTLFSSCLCVFVCLFVFVCFPGILFVCYVCVLVVVLYVFFGFVVVCLCVFLLLLFGYCCLFLFFVLFVCFVLGFFSGGWGGRFFVFVFLSFFPPSMFPFAVVKCFVG